MKRKRSSLLRPVAWIATVVLIYCIGLVSTLVCTLGAWAVSELSRLSTGMVILLVILLGSVYIGLYFYSGILLPHLLVFVSDFIYPSNHAFRYYFSGIITLIFCAFSVIGCIRGWIVQTGDTSIFWFYATYAHLALSAIIMMLRGRSSSEDRHKEVAENAL